MAMFTLKSVTKGTIVCWNISLSKQGKTNVLYSKITLKLFSYTLDKYLDVAPAILSLLEKIRSF